MAVLAERTWAGMALARRAGAYMEEKGIQGGGLDAELLLAELLGLNRLELYLQFDRPITPTELAQYRTLIRRRARREPLQYITGKAAFREIELAVDRRVAIPRPETELLVGEILAWAGRRGALRAHPTVLEIGTGSGAIALSLLGEDPFHRVVATDLSADALDVASANARALGLEGRIEFRQGDCFDPLEAGERFDVIVSNPPYIPSGEIESLEPEVRQWEPALALDGGVDGLRELRRIVAGAPSWLNPGGLLALEVGHRQAEPVSATVRASPYFAAARISPDLACRDRFVLGRARERRQQPTST